jgi:hypothetical protein
MPVSWLESERLAERRSDESHALSFRADAICYMLSNNTIKSRRPTRVLSYMPAADLLADSYFLSFLLRRALGHERAAPTNGFAHPDRREKRGPFDEGAFDYLATRFGARTMIDVGCGSPGMVYYALCRGVRAVGVDGDPRIARESRVVIEHDYAQKPLYAGEFDLGWSVEFVEHLEERFVPHVMATFRGCRHVFLATGASGSPGHPVNCRPPQYWIEQFRAVGFALDAEATDAVRHHSTTEDRSAQNTGLVFCRV